MDAINILSGGAAQGLVRGLADVFRTQTGFAIDGEFSAGDLLMVSVLRRLETSGLLEQYSNLAAYVARGIARPAYRRAFDAQLAVFTALHRAG